MTVLDDKMIPKIFAIIERYGKSVTFTVEAVQSYNPATGETTAATPVTHTRKVTPPTAYEQRFVDGETIRAGDMKVFVAAQGLAFVPALDQRVTIDSVAWRIMAVGPIYTGELVALYELQLRK